MPKLNRKPPQKSVSPGTSRTPSGPSRRAVLWLLGLGLAALLIHGVWTWLQPSHERSRGASPNIGQVASLTDENDREDPSESGPILLEAAGESENTSHRVPAPGSADRRFLAPLADAYRRINPAEDGWQSEAFNEAASAQLKRLAHLFEDSVDNSILESLVAEDFRCTPLAPDTLREVFRDGTMDVYRAASLPSLRDVQDQTPFHGRAGLGQAIKLFRHQYNGAKLNIKLKPFRIRSGKQGAVTQVYFQSVGDSQTGRLQVNARWTLGWSTAQDDRPKLIAIQLDDYEAVRRLGFGGPLFADCTESVMGRTAGYREQFVYSTDHWRSRLPRDLGLDVVANHGLAIGDVNGDDLEDVYVCQQGGLPNRLLLQNPDGTLRDFTLQSAADWLDYCASALLVDFDNDGDRDLVVAQEWRILLMSNDGSGRFELEFGTSSHAQSFSMAASDFDLDGDVDVYICGYNPPAALVRRGVMGEPLPYHDANNGGRNMLLRNDGNWLFKDVTAEVGLDQNNSRFSFAASWEDFDNDGDPDLYVANDYGRNNLYRNTNGRFEDVAAQRNVEDMSAGMSVSWADCNRDGWMDLYVSNMFSAAGNRITYQRQFKSHVDPEVRRQFQRHARGNTLFVNTGDGGFRDVSEQAAVTMGRWAWGSKFADLNGDGWEDLVVANGFISSQDTGDL